VNRTVSIGAACYPLHSVDSSDLRERCLEALHRAQADGGNKVVVLKIRG
jgi:GGDEF domain-containing protein